MQYKASHNLNKAFYCSKFVVGVLLCARAILSRWPLQHLLILSVSVPVSYEPRERIQHLKPSGDQRSSLSLGKRTTPFLNRWINVRKSKSASCRNSFQYSLHPFQSTWYAIHTLVIRIARTYPSHWPCSVCKNVYRLPCFNYSTLFLFFFILYIQFYNHLHYRF